MEVFMFLDLMNTSYIKKITQLFVTHYNRVKLCVFLCLYIYLIKIKNRRQR